jgi:hypothetical protein
MQQTNKTETDPAEAFLTKVTEVIAPLVQDLEIRLDKANYVQEKLTQHLDETHREVINCKELIQKKEVRTPPPNTALFEIIADKWYQKMAAKLESLPKKHSFRILFFPEHNTVEYLKKLWGFVLKWLFLIVLLKPLYSLSDKWLDGHNEENRYKNAWKTLYDNGDRKSKKIMDEVLENK